RFCALPTGETCLSSARASSSRPRNCRISVFSRASWCATISSTADQAHPDAHDYDVRGRGRLRKGEGKMSPMLETPPDATEAPEHRAPPHPAVLDPDRRKDTELPSGLIPAKDAVRMAGYPGIMYLGIRGLEPLRLGDEVPYYEVAIHGTVYRGLARPVPGQS